MSPAEAQARAADALANLPPSPPRCVVGFDGFLDSVLRVVDTRRSPRPDDYDRIETLTAFAERIAATSGRSTNIELDLVDVRFGGNGPLMAGGLARLGLPTTYLGAVGQAADPTALDPAFAPLALRGADVIPFAAPGLTDAYEFRDGRINFNRPAPLRGVTPEALLKVVGRDRLLDLLRSARLLAVVNWTLVHGADAILDLLAEDLLPAANNPGLVLFAELSAAARRPDEDIRALLARLTRFSQTRTVVLGLNRAEAERVCAAAALDPAGLDAPGTDAAEGERLAAVAARVREHAGLHAVALHVHRGSAVAGPDGAFWLPGRHNPSPAIQTGAGDHYNAGLAAALALGLPLPAGAALANALAGAYVSTGDAPTRDQVIARLGPAPAADTR